MKKRENNRKERKKGKLEINKCRREQNETKKRHEEN